MIVQTQRWEGGMSASHINPLSSYWSEFYFHVYRQPRGKLPLTTFTPRCSKINSSEANVSSFISLSLQLHCFKKTYSSQSNESAMQSSARPSQIRFEQLQCYSAQHWKECARSHQTDATRSQFIKNSVRLSDLVAPLV